METLLQGIQNVLVSINDILVTGTTREVCLNTLNEVIRRLKKVGLCLEKCKCHFMSPSVVFLEHKIDAQGGHLLAPQARALRTGLT